MPDDSSFFQVLFDRSPWTLFNVLTLLIALISMLAALAGFLSWWQQRWKGAPYDLPKHRPSEWVPEWGRTLRISADTSGKQIPPPGP